ncbi:MAG: DUF2846 domain-containing protein [Methylosarcina sp.]
MEKLFFLIAITFLSGCANTGAKFNPDNIEKAPTDKTLVYFYRPSALQANMVSFEIIANKINIGKLDNGAYLKRILLPNRYKIHSDTMAIDRISTFDFEAGKTYFVKTYFEMGTWVNSVRFSLMHKDDAILEMHNSRVQIEN